MSHNGIAGARTRLSLRAEYTAGRSNCVNVFAFLWGAAEKGKRCHSERRFCAKNLS